MHVPETIEIQLGMLSSHTIAMLHLEYEAYIADMNPDSDHQGDRELLQEDSNGLLAYLTHEHFSGDQAAAEQCLEYVEAHPVIEVPETIEEEPTLWDAVITPSTH